MARLDSRAYRTAGIAALAMSVAVAFGGCSGSGSTPAPANAGTNAPANQGTSGAQQPSAAGNPSTGGLDGAVTAFSSIKSYRFKIIMKGGSYGDLLGESGMSGTIVVAPPAADVTIMGMQMREIGGKSFVKMGETWTESTDKSSSSLADSMSPQKLFGSYLGSDLAASYKPAGDEQKNGVATTHWVANADAMDRYGSLLGVTGGTWSAEVWIAKDGGYPVGMKMASTGGSSNFLMSIDVTNVNDPANVIDVPKI